MIKAADSLAASLGIAFEDAGLLEQALTHRSAAAINSERLEFLGDAILGFVIADRIFTDNTTASEGDMSRLRAALVRKETLAEIAVEWKVGDFLKLGSGELKSGGFRRSSILADAIEAIIGATYKDQGFAAARQLIEKLYGDRLKSLATQTIRKDAKSRLQEALQGQGIELPTYEVVLEEGPAHKRHFEIKCAVNELQIQATGAGKSLRIAEQKAASAVLKLMSDTEKL